MKGFFNKHEIARANCGLCRLDKTSSTPRQAPRGNGSKRIMLLSATPLLPESLEALRARLSSLGVDLQRDCWLTESVCCASPYRYVTTKPGEVSPYGEPPTAAQVDACHPRVAQHIRELNPACIIALGHEAHRSVLTDFYTEGIGTEEHWRGWNIPDRERNCWICPTWGASSQALEAFKPAPDLLWKRDLRLALACATQKLPADPTDVDVITDVKEVKRLLVKWSKPGGPVAFDYETSGLKPDCPGHFIYTVAASNGTVTVSALLEDVNDECLGFLEGARPKIAHSAKFEKRWTSALLGVNVKNWFWDTLLAAHVQDNRPQICSLKFQAFIHFGVADYDSAIKPFLRAETSNGFNTIRKAPLPKLLRYNGLDALLTWHLWKLQTKGLEL